MKKRTYRARPVKTVNEEKLSEALRDRRVIVGVDIAKYDVYAAFMMDAPSGWSMKTTLTFVPISRFAAASLGSVRLIPRTKLNMAVSAFLSRT